MEEVGCLFFHDISAIAEHLALWESQATFLSYLAIITWNWQRGAFLKAERCNGFGGLK